MAVDAVAALPPKSIQETKTARASRTAIIEALVVMGMPSSVLSESAGALCDNARHR
jgi:hypothetical protein